MPNIKCLLLFSSFYLPNAFCRTYCLGQKTYCAAHASCHVTWGQGSKVTTVIGSPTSTAIFTVRRYALHCLIVIVILSVCLSVTLVDCVHMVRPMIMISSPYGSSIILVSGDITFIPKFEVGHPTQGRWMRVGWVRIGDVRPISRRISETVRDTTKARAARPPGIPVLKVKNCPRLV